MSPHASRIAAALFLAACGHALAQTSDPRLREIAYDPHAVVTIPVQRGLVTHILLEGDAGITEVASGVGSDCSKAEATWCVAAQPGGHSLFVKPKSTATSANNLAVTTERRAYSFRLVVLADHDSAVPVYRIVVKAPPATKPSHVSEPPLAVPTIALPAAPSPEALVAERLTAAPKLENSSYSIAEGEASDDIVPTLIFDDGRFTYFRFPGNREIPAVFQVLGDGGETLVNTRMEGDLLVVDRVGRRLTLRAGNAVVGVWNDAFDLEGAPPIAGTTVPGVRRALGHSQTGVSP